MINEVGFQSDEMISRTRSSSQEFTHRTGTSLPTYFYNSTKFANASSILEVAGFSQ